MFITCMKNPFQPSYLPKTLHFFPEIQARDIPPSCGRQIDGDTLILLGHSPFPSGKELLPFKERSEDSPLLPAPSASTLVAGSGFSQGRILPEAAHILYLSRDSFNYYGSLQESWGWNSSKLPTTDLTENLSGQYLYFSLYLYFSPFLYTINFLLHFTAIEP